MIIFESSVRSLALAGVAGLCLALFRVRSSTVRLAVWRLVLFGSLLLPLASIPWPRQASTPAIVRHIPSLAIVPAQFSRPATIPATHPGIDWAAILIRAYSLAAGLLLLRTLLGLARVHRLAQSAVPIPELAPGAFESPEIKVPVTCGLIHRRILLPSDWREWSLEARTAVLAHERSHVAQHDYLTQFLSRVNCAIQWCNPLSWWLRAKLVSLAEEVSDDAALKSVIERPSYASLLLGFATRGERLSAAVAMARQTPVAGRIDRILDDNRPLSRPLGVLTHSAVIVSVLVTAFVIGACQLSTVQAQSKKPSPTTPERNVENRTTINGTISGTVHGTVDQGSQTFYSRNDDGGGWALMSPNSVMSGFGPSSRAIAAQRELKGPYLWFSRNGQEYLIDDRATVNQVSDWMRPQEELGRQQGELGNRQGELGDQMGKLGDQMGKLGDQMSKVTVEMPKLKEQLARLQAEVERLGNQVTVSDLGELQSRIGEIQSHIGDVQGSAGDRQSRIGELQAELGEKQAKLGEQQAKLGEQQAKLGEQQERLANEVNEKVQRLFDQAIQDGRAKPVR